jgi:multiple sugar transport system substrate-binding protein
LSHYLEVNWDVVVAGLDYVDNPSHEEGMPGYREARDRYLAFAQRFTNEPDFDFDAELELLRDDLQTIFDTANVRN